MWREVYKSKAPLSWILLENWAERSDSLSQAERKKNSQRHETKGVAWETWFTGVRKGRFSETAPVWKNIHLSHDVETSLYVYKALAASSIHNHWATLRIIIASRCSMWLELCHFSVYIPSYQQERLNIYLFVQTPSEAPHHF